jgi:hypothetical protein
VIRGFVAKNGSFPMACRQVAWGYVALLVAGVLAIGCHKTSGDSAIPSAVPGKCSGVWSSTYDQCLIDSQCIGFACFWAMQHCSSRANQELSVCCATNFTDPADRQTCMDSLGDSP